VRRLLFQLTNLFFSVNIWTQDAQNGFKPVRDGEDILVEVELRDLLVFLTIVKLDELINFIHHQVRPEAAVDA